MGLRGYMNFHEILFGNNEQQWTDYKYLDCGAVCDYVQHHGAFVICRTLI